MHPQHLTKPLHLSNNERKSAGVFGAFSKHGYLQIYPIVEKTKSRSDNRDFSEVWRSWSNKCCQFLALISQRSQSMNPLKIVIFHRELTLEAIALQFKHNNTSKSSAKCQSKSCYTENTITFSRLSYLGSNRTVKSLFWFARPLHDEHEIHFVLKSGALIHFIILQNASVTRSQQRLEPSSKCITVDRHIYEMYVIFFMVRSQLCLARYNKVIIFMIFKLARCTTRGSTSMNSARKFLIL